MTDARKWLGRARSIDREITALRSARQEAWDQLTRITQNYTSDGAQTSKDPHKLDKIAELVDLINRKEDELARVRLETMEAIIQVPSGNQRAVLLSYFVAGKTLEEIAVENKCSARNVQNVRKRGILWLEKNYREVP